MVVMKRGTRLLALREILFSIILISFIEIIFIWTRFYWHQSKSQGRNYNLIPFEHKDPLITYYKETYPEVLNCGEVKKGVKSEL